MAYETLTLEERNELRKSIIKKYENELNEIKNKTIKQTPTGRKSLIDKNRNWSINAIKGVGLKDFKDDDEEYKNIGNNLRGMCWMFLDDGKTFDEDETKILFDIARNFGCFEY
jgi:hypothetical protein